MYLRLTYLFTILFLCTLCSAQNRGVAVSQHPDSLVVASMLNYDQVLVFDSVEIHVGELSEDDEPQTYRFAFTNAGNEPVVITKVSSSCGCTATSYSSEPVQAGQRAEISVRYSPKGHPGKLHRNVFVYTNLTDVRPTARLALRGFVQPTKDQWRAYRVTLSPSLRAKSNRVRFRAMPRTGKRVERIECVNTGTSPLRLSASQESLVPYLALGTDPELILPGQVADLVITLDADKLPAQCGQTLEHAIRIEGMEGDPLQRTLQIEADFIN